MGSVGRLVLVHSPFTMPSHRQLSELVGDGQGRATRHPRRPAPVSPKLRHPAGRRSTRSTSMGASRLGASVGINLAVGVSQRTEARTKGPSIIVSGALRLRECRYARRGIALRVISMDGTVGWPVPRWPPLGTTSAFQGLYHVDMCRYAQTVYKVHYVCVACRRSHKYFWARQHLCTSCRRPMAFAGHDFAAPRRRDNSGWNAVAAVLGAGLRYEGFSTCGCSREPEFRPRTSAQVRMRRRVARRAGVLEAEALVARDPHDLVCHTPSQ